MNTPGSPLGALPSPDPRWFHKPEGIHGVSHTLRVMGHVRQISLALGLKPLEHEAALTAALWHDIGRAHDGGDRLHGAKSVGKVDGLGLARGLDPDLARLALFAVEFHSMPDRDAPQSAKWHPDPQQALRVLWVLKDADGLDRVRLEPHDGLNPKKLRFECSKRMQAEARETFRVIP